MNFEKGDVKYIVGLMFTIVSALIMAYERSWYLPSLIFGLGLGLILNRAERRPPNLLGG